MGVRIGDMTEATSLAGTENFPASVSGSPRRVLASTLFTFIRDQFEAVSAAGAVADADGFYMKDATDGVMKPVALSVMAQHIIDQVWGKADAGTPSGTDTIAIKDAGGTEQTATLTNLAAYILSAIENTILDVSDVATASSVNTTDYVLLTQTTTPKKTTIQDIYDAIYTGLAAHVNGKSSAGTVLGTDEIYLVRSGTGYKTTPAALATYIGTVVTLSGSGTSGKLASWTGTTSLGDTYAVADSGAGFNAGDDTTIPTTAAVRGELDTLVYDQTDIGAALADADELMVDDGGLGTTQRKTALSRIWTWIKTKTDLPLTMLDLDGGTDIGAALADADLLIVDDGAGGTNRKSALSRVWTYIQSKITSNMLQDMTEGSGVSNAAVVQHSVEVVGGLKKTSILIDLTGLEDGGTTADIIGNAGGAANCHFGQITAARNGTIIAGKITCFETPAGSDADIDLYSAAESTGAQDALVTDLTETLLVNHGNWAAEDVDYLTSLPAANEYLYLADGAGPVSSAYTGGIFLIELWGV